MIKIISSANTNSLKKLVSNEHNEDIRYAILRPIKNATQLSFQLVSSKPDIKNNKDNIYLILKLQGPYKVISTKLLKNEKMSIPLGLTDFDTILAKINQFTPELNLSFVYYPLLTEKFKNETAILEEKYTNLSNQCTSLPDGLAKDHLNARLIACKEKVEQFNFNDAERPFALISSMKEELSKIKATLSAIENDFLFESLSIKINSIDERSATLTDNTFRQFIGEELDTIKKKNLLSSIRNKESIEKGIDIINHSIDAFPCELLPA